MKKLLPWLALVVILLAGCRQMAINIVWDSTAPVPTQTLTPVPVPPTQTVSPSPLPPSATVPPPTPTPEQVAPAALAFASHGRIFWADTQGQVYPLSDSAYPYSAPLLSPNGEFVVFMGARPEPPLKGWVLKDIVLASTTRSFEPRVLVGSSTDILIGFSPDSQWLLTRRAIIKYDQDWLDFSLQAINLSTGEDRLVLGPVQRADGSIALPVNPQWAPDSRHIFFDTIARCGLCFPNGELNVLDIESLETHALLPAQNFGSLVFSADGSRLLVAGNSRLLLMNTADIYAYNETFQPQVLMTYEPPQSAGISQALPQARWVEDGSGLVRLALPQVVDDKPALVFWEISTGDLTLKELASYTGVEFLLDGGPFPHNMLPAFWSADMSRLALNLRIKTNAEDRIDIIMADGAAQNPVELLHSPLFVNWSPDNLHFIFLMPPAGAYGDLMAETKDVFLSRADNGGESSPLLPEGGGLIAPRSIRWLDASTYVFETIEEGGNVTWRGVLGGEPKRLE